MTSDKKLAELTEFEGVLDTFGGDPRRWPAGKRERLMGLAAADKDARRLLREAEALDTVLSRAAGPPVGDTARLAARIAAAAAGSAQAGPTAAGTDRAQNAADDHSGGGKAGVVIAWPGSGTGGKTVARTAALTGSVPRRDRPMTQWRTAAALAASLVLGVFVGAMDFVPSGFSGLVPGIEASADTPRELALLQGDDLLDLLDERWQ